MIQNKPKISVKHNAIIKTINHHFLSIKNKKVILYPLTQSESPLYSLKRHTSLYRVWI